MKATSSVSASSGVFLTDLGRQDLRSLPTCVCRPIRDDDLIRCRGCGTVYGLVTQLHMQGFERKSRRD